MSSAPHPALRLERPLPPTPISYEAFLEWVDEDTHAEWVDGQIVLMAPASIDHQDISGLIFRLVASFVERHQLGRVWFMGISMRLPTRPSGREPDLLFLATANAHRIRPTHLDGPADLVVEVVSPDSVQRDLADKVREYEAAAIPEYWTIDPLRQTALFRQMSPGGRYRLVAPDAAGYYHSVVLPGFRLRPDWLWRRPLPLLAEVEPEISR
jgi:Uma2 family endonuclease